MKRVNLVYTFPVPDNPTSLNQAVWIDVALYSLDAFLYGIGRINNACHEPVVPEYIAELMKQPDDVFRNQCDMAIAEMLNNAPGLFRCIVECTLDRETRYVISLRYRAICQQWVKLYLNIQRQEACRDDNA